MADERLRINPTQPVPEIYFSYKKVLLCEQKRHIACHVASACYAALSNGCGVPGVPPLPSRPGQGVPQVPPHPDLARGDPGYPHHQDLVGRYPGYPLTIQTWDGVHPPDLGWSTPPWPGTGYPPPPRPGMGLRCELTNKLKTVPSPILRMRVVTRRRLSRQRNSFCFYVRRQFLY